MAVDAARAAELLSAFRASNNLGPVVVESRLMQIATNAARTNGENDKASHTAGGSLPARTNAVGYEWDVVAENLGADFRQVDDVMVGWQDSTAHRAVLLNPNVTEMGIAAVTTPRGSRHRNYWAIILGKPKAVAVATQ